LTNRGQAALRAQRKALGLCQACGYERAAEGKTLCQLCLDIRKRNSEKSIIAKLKALACTRCGGARDKIDKRICGSCRERDIAGAIEKKRRHEAESGAPICPRCKIRPGAPGWSYCEICIGRSKHYRDSLKADVIAGYGGVCKCCGEAEPQFLTIDHVNGGGSAHKKAVGSNQQIYSYLRANNYPTGYQLLCSNCNSAKGAFGICPHERDRRKDPNYKVVEVVMVARKKCGRPRHPNSRVA
jgi:hypothetical protein